MNDLFDVNQLLWFVHESESEDEPSEPVPPNFLDYIAHLLIGKNFILVGPPGSGKTRLAKEIWTAFCMKPNGKSPSRVPRIVTANVEWTTYDVIGGPIIGGSGQPRFRPGFLTEVCLACKKSVEEYNLPIFLIIDEINRANLDLAFGKVFTLLDVEHRKDPLISDVDVEGMLNAGEYAGLMMPIAFRILATMNSEDRALLFSLGYAFRRRFAFVEVPSPYAVPVQIVQTEDLKKVWQNELTPDQDNEWAWLEKELNRWLEEVESSLQEGSILNPPTRCLPKSIPSAEAYWSIVKTCHDKIMKDSWSPFHPYRLAHRIANELGKRGIAKMGYGQIVDAVRYVLALLAFQDSLEDINANIPSSCDKAVLSYILPHVEAFMPRIRRMMATGERNEEQKAKADIQSFKELLARLGLSDSARRMDQYIKGLTTGDMPTI